MTDIDAKQFKDWLNARDVVCSLAVRQGVATFIIHPHDLSFRPLALGSSEDLGEAIRLALLQFDMATASSDDPNDLLDPNTFPCPECGKPVREVRAARTETGWLIESATGVGSLQACCVAKDLVFTDEKEALWYAHAIEKWARGAT